MKYLENTIYVMILILTIAFTYDVFLNGAARTIDLINWLGNTGIVMTVPMLIGMILIYSKFWKEEVEEE